MDNLNKKCISLASEIKKLENEISEREGPFNSGIKLIVPVADAVTEKNMSKLNELKEEYNSSCK